VATTDFISFRAGDVTGFEVGSGPLTLALHGWGGRPAQMAALARALAASGRRVVIPELPGKAGGERTDIVVAAESVAAVVESEGTPDLVVAHSFAALVARLAFSDAVPSTAVFLAPALDVNDIMGVFVSQLRLLPWAERGLRRHLEKWDPALWPSLSNLQPDQLEGTRLLIFHDPADDETPFHRSAALAAMRPGTELVVVEGLGHNRLLNDPGTIGQVVAATPAGVARAPQHSMRD
jgi:hypothetical protein